ncbi:MAG: glutathione S-transferase N-terminal domain-containing protein [Gammaproteobacteria bacterium]
MKWLFKTVRALMSPVSSFIGQVSSSNGVTRSDEEQRSVDEQTRALALYQFRACLFCFRVRRAIKRLSLNIETRDIQHDPSAYRELLQGGGDAQVPCLRIVGDDGKATWMYESADIIAYLYERFAP